MKVIITKFANRVTATAADLAAEYKYRGFERHYAWDMFVKDRGMKPEITAKEFYTLFENVSASPIDKPCEIEFTPTHMDTMLNLACQIHDDECGIHHIIWADGMTGSNPPTDTTFTERFVRLQTPLALDGTAVLKASGDTTADVLDGDDILPEPHRQ